jgi:ABC-type dipeptide/oligopeptide/nickel transport system ATPase component
VLAAIRNGSDIRGYFWEQLSGNTLKKTYISDEDFLAGMEVQPYEHQIGISHFYHLFYRGDLYNFEIGPHAAEATELYPEMKDTKSGFIEGDIRISGFLKSQETLARISGYCEHNDIHSPQVTVRGSLLYSAFLRLPKDVDKETRTDFVDEVIELVELDNLRDALVGLPGISELSTEQRKRLTINVELVANPSIIFMDEPTSGLDARAAAIVM